MCFFLWCSNGDRHGDVSQRNLKATNERESVDMCDFRREEYLFCGVQMEIGMEM